jgi:trans-2,3-dihydro-3-hydroxyanthranilate isomerase
MVEDPATGSATAALTALLAELRSADVRLRVLQGEDMGRPSTLLTRAVREGQTTRAYVGGRCAAMFEGAFNLS